MSFKDYLEDHTGFIMISFLFLMLEGFLLLCLGVTNYFIILFASLWFVLFLLYFLFTYYRKRKRMQELERLITQLDQPYLLHEVMPTGGTCEEHFYQYLLRIGNKGMLDKVSTIERERKAYQEYIEQWVHEIKTLIAAMNLWAENQEKSRKRELLTQIERTQHFVEQALFYARSEHVANDFAIQEVDLLHVVQESLMQCKYLCINEKVSVVIPEHTYFVRSDAKWLVFIFNQLIENAVKYRDKAKESTLEIAFIKTATHMEVHVIDNGIGISTQDMDRLFIKGFTGENGRNANQHATGIGLYLCKKLCASLEIALNITSLKHEGSDVCLSFLLTKL